MSSHNESLNRDKWRICHMFICLDYKPVEDRNNQLIEGNFSFSLDPDNQSISIIKSLSRLHE